MPTRSKIESQLELFQSNAYPAMLADLAEHLGVTADSLFRLAIGYAPIVVFGKQQDKPSFCGWWAVPERDEDGVPIGIGLRNSKDAKFMFPKSQHDGLIYAVNPEHDRGSKGYDAGPQNWVRTMAAGVMCPICGKPDGCLVSAENPEDPKAVVCIRISEGSVRPLRFGHLHIRKPDGNLQGRSVLADNGGPVLVVEGMSDTATALDLGFDGIGRPSNLAGVLRLPDILRGREVWVIGENDQKADGKWPGKEGMLAAFQSIRSTTKHVKMVMPPTFVKDLRAWKNKYGLTRQGLQDYVVEHGVEHCEEPIIEDSRPTTIARTFLSQRFKLAGRNTLRRWNENWYVYAGSKYRVVKTEAFARPLYEWGYTKQVKQRNADGSERLEPFAVTTTLVANVDSALIAETLVEADTIPVWINGATGPDPKDLIVFSNGILNVPAFLDGKTDYLTESTPDIFTTAALPFAFDPTAVCPNWMKYLRTSLGDDASKIMLLREWFGYCMTPDTSHQKMMYMRGPTGSGKGTALNVLANLVGMEQTAFTSFANLAGDFGSAPLVGKLIALIPDARITDRNKSMRGLEIMLNISGNDGVSVNRKFKDELERQKLMCRITIASNEFLELPDHAGAMLRRLNIIEYANSTIVSRPDIDLERKLVAEIPGIAVWALQGLRRLREVGHFTVPSSSIEAMKEWRTTTSPTAGFLEDCCDEDAGGQVGKDELYDVWSKWGAERGTFNVPKSRFYQRMLAAAPYAKSETFVKGGHKFSVFRGIALKDWAAKTFLGRP